MNIKPIIKPILNNLPFLYDALDLGTGGTDAARYCYGVWLRHLVRLHDNGISLPGTMAELGPGDSIGVGLAAVLTGVNKYYALDIKAYAEPERNLRILDDLAELFKARMDIPDEREFPLVQPKLHSYEFPHDILSEASLERTLAPDRIEHIKRIIRQGGGGDDSGLVIKYQAPWNDPKIIRQNSVDVVLAQAVLEHADDPGAVYESLGRWLRPGGILSQDIDFKSHNTTWAWNGHWGVGTPLWRLIRGRREWGINRRPHSEHIKMIKAAGMEILTDEVSTRDDGIGREKLAGEFKDMADDDLRTAEAFVQARKR